MFGLVYHYRGLTQGYHKELIELKHSGGKKNDDWE